jgi:hypothetical protein
MTLTALVALMRAEHDRLTAVVKASGRDAAAKNSVMAGLDPVIHAFLSISTKHVDARVRPGHDEEEMTALTSSPCSHPS